MPPSAPPPRDLAGAPAPPGGAAPAAGDTLAPEPLVEETRVGATEAGRAINLALLALSRTARSFQIYDPHNEAVAGFLDDLREKVRRAFAAAGPIALQVRPFELVWKDEVVYLERDRDRSLAFRFFRDGLRRLTLAPDMPWEEVLGLLEILSVRYAGVRQQEDDLVTLLAKAGFQHLTIEAVEGFVPNEEVAEEGPSAQRIDIGVEPPADWDLPRPPPLPPAQISFQDLPAAGLAALRAEEDPEALADNSVALVLELLEVIADPAEQTAIEDVLPLVSEVRDFLFGEGAVRPLIALVQGLGRASAGDMRPVASPVLAFSTDEAVLRLLRGLRAGAPDDDEALPPEVFDYLAVIPGDRLTQLMDLLPNERDSTVRRRMLKVIERLAEQRPDHVLRRLTEADPLTARDLLGAFAAGVPHRALDGALALKDHADAMVQLEVLQVLASVPYGPQVGRTVLHMLSAPDERVHILAIEILATRGEQRAFDTMARYAEEHAGGALSERAAEALGEALARVAPAGARTLFDGWLRPKGLLRKLVDTPAQRKLAWAAVAGLGQIAGDEAEAALRGLIEKATGELHSHIVATLVLRRRRLQAPSGPRSGGSGRP